MHCKRINIKIFGVVQGVGFRPYVYRHACAMNLSGFIQNTMGGVTIEVEGHEENLERFLHQLQTAVPPHAYVQSLQYSYLDPIGYQVFEILPSEPGGGPAAMILPDIATCPDCLNDISDPNDPHYGYAFTNCTHCGPRYSIMYALPYDRTRTSMKRFIMCARCQSEYDDPTNRRFHAQPNACPDCGPRLELWDARGQSLCSGDAALQLAAHHLQNGRIVMVKGLGGFHFMADALDENVVSRLRKSKGHEQKPLAVMCPDIHWAECLSYVTQKERRLLLSPEAPIVLLTKKDPQALAGNIAPQNPYWGLLMPYTPLHHLLFRLLKRPMVATSANLAEEPICTDEFEAVDRLGEVADFFLVHDRPIVRHADDSIIRLVGGRPMVLRRARGYAPLPVTVNCPLADTLGYGGQLKSTVAVSRGRNVYLSPHIGDLENPRTWITYKAVMGDMQGMFGLSKAETACDAHPDYLSTRLALTHDRQVTRVQHHHAHIAACMAENRITGKVLGICWDGTGWGDDGTIWGGEFLECDEQQYRRLYHLRRFPLPGGEQAIREPRRAALGLLWALGDGLSGSMVELPAVESFKRSALKNLLRMLQAGTSCPWTSSMGRLFDAVASLTGIAHINHFEGQAAQQLEFSGYEYPHAEAYPYRIQHGEVDWEPMVLAILDDIRQQKAPGIIATAFQNTLVEMAVGVCHRAGLDRVVISGGCFQNKTLTERLISRLKDQHYQVYWPQQIPPNDGGIALGQCIVAGARRHRELSAIDSQTSGPLTCA